LEETESEYYEIIYHTNVSCSSKGSVLWRFIERYHIISVWRGKGV
jgi:hypothetical protein